VFLVKALLLHAIIGWGKKVGIFEDREVIEVSLNRFGAAFRHAYIKLCNERCPTLHRKLPFFKQGFLCTIVYGVDPFLILEKDSRLPPGEFNISTWDESEYPQLSTVNDADIMAAIIASEEVLCQKKLDSLLPEYLNSVLNYETAEELAGALLEENMHAVKSSLEDAVAIMKQAYELLFRLENGLRQLIEQELKRHFGEGDWWEKGATYHAKKESHKNQQDPRWKWHEPMKASPLNYVNFDTLHDIIVNKNWEIFKDIFGPQATFSANFKSLEVPRNKIAHNNVLSEEELHDFSRSARKLLQIVKVHLKE
jgi:hypothetical protein